ncbi:MAG: chemotaxis response regulator protein-glutamate methylesterase [Desulfovibrionaceae bacterium]
MIKVLVVDDSAFMRRVLTSLLSQDADIEIAGTARDGEDALIKIASLKPDVITMDIEMPRMDGLATLQQIMKTGPLPVIMISSLTESGAEATLKALEYGALDFIPKSLNNNNHDQFAQELIRKIRAVSRKKSLLQLRFGRTHSPLGQTQPTYKTLAPTIIGGACQGARDVVAIGVSTGGPPAVQKMLAALPANFPACILIAQHMPAAFTGPFAKRLDNLCQITVKEAQQGDRLQHGVAYVAPGGQHLMVTMRGAIPEITITSEPSTALYKPSVNVLIESVAKHLARKSIGIILTGMGSDGLEGIRQLKAKGGYILAQNEQSCVVYGMPKAIVDAQLADQILDIDHMAGTLITAIKG